MAKAKDDRARVKLTFSKKELRQVERAMKRLHRWDATATAVRKTLLLVCENIEAFQAMVTRSDQKAPEDPTGAHEAPEVPCPSPAPACVDLQDKQTDIQESISNLNPVTAVANAIRESEWYGAKLPKEETPETYAAKLLRRYKDMNPDDVYDASLWLLNHPNERKKYIGGFLTNWMRNKGKFSSKSNNRPLRAHQAANKARAEQTDWTAGTTEIDVSDIDPDEPADFDDIPDPKKDRRQQ